MGQAASQAANAEGQKASTDLTTLMHVLENKKDEFLLRVKSTRGAGIDTTREIQGGRSVMRFSDIRVCTSENYGVGQNRIDGCIGDFFKHAQGGDCGKKCAVLGCKHLIKSHLDSIFSCHSGCGMEKSGFVILFLNFAFVRVDYHVYTYALSGSTWGKEVNRSGSCYVADIAVLDPCHDVRPGEIDYLLGQALCLPPCGDDDDDEHKNLRQREYYAIMKMKIQLVTSMVLSRLLSKECITMDEIQCATEKLIETQELINKEFGYLKDHVYH
jgi:hypothetical protein